MWSLLLWEAQTSGANRSCVAKGARSDSCGALAGVWTPSRSLFGALASRLHVRLL